MFQYGRSEIRLIIRIDTRHTADIFRFLFLKDDHRIVYRNDPHHTVFMIHDRQGDQTVFHNGPRHLFLIIRRLGVKHIRVHDLFDQPGLSRCQEVFDIHCADQMPLLRHITGIDGLAV